MWKLFKHTELSWLIITLMMDRLDLASQYKSMQLNHSTLHRILHGTGTVHLSCRTVGIIKIKYNDSDDVDNSTGNVNYDNMAVPVSLCGAL